MVLCAHIRTSAMRILSVQGRIRGTYGINAKPLEADPPPESPPAPGVTRASLRPKPVAKQLPDDEEADGVKPAAALRHARGHAASGADAAAVQGSSPSSPKVQGAEGTGSHSSASFTKTLTVVCCKGALQLRHLVSTLLAELAVMVSWRAGQTTHGKHAASLLCICSAFCRLQANPCALSVKVRCVQDVIALICLYAAAIGCNVSHDSFLKRTVSLCSAFYV